MDLDGAVGGVTGEAVGAELTIDTLSETLILAVVDAPPR